MTDLYELEPQPFDVADGKIKPLSPEDKRKIRHILVDIDDFGKWTDAVTAFFNAVKTAEINQEHFIFTLIFAYLRLGTSSSMSGFLERLLSS